MSTLPDQDWELFVDRLEGFFAYWENKTGQTVSLDVRLECYHFLGVAKERDILKEGDDVASLLRPLVCKSPWEQAQFNSLFWKFIGITTPRVAADPIVPVPEPIRPQDRVPITRSRIYTLLGVILFLGLLAVIIIKWPPGDPPPPTNPKVVLSSKSVFREQLSDSIPIKIADWKKMKAFKLVLVYDQDVLTIDSFSSEETFQTTPIVALREAPSSYLITSLREPTGEIKIGRDTILFGHLHFNWLNTDSKVTSISLDTVVSYLGEDRQLFLSQSASLSLRDEEPRNWWVVIWTVIFCFSVIYLLVLLYRRFALQDVASRWLDRRRRYSGEVTDVATLFLRDQIFKINDLWGWLPYASRLSYRQSVETRKIDFPLTAKKTSANWGVYSPGYSTQDPTATFVALIDRSTFNDHQAEYALSYIRQLQKKNINVLLGYFDNDPRVIYIPEQQARIDLSVLQRDYPESHGLIFSNLSSIYSPYTGKPEAWAKELTQTWPSTSLFTPENLKPSNKFKQLSRLGLEIHPLSPSGFWDYIQQREIGSSDHLSHLLPLNLRDDQLTSIFAPTHDKQVELLETLNEFLGIHGYYWLAACAKFPEIHFELTLQIGQKLERKDGQGSLFQHDIFLRLMQLPWFRQGYMPKWFREIVFFTLESWQQSAIEETLGEIIYQGLRESEGQKKIEVNLPKSLFPAFKAKVLAIFLRRQPPESVFHDELFASVFRDKTSLRFSYFKAEKRKSAVNPTSLPVNKLDLISRIFITTLTIIGALILFAFSAGLLPILMFWPDLSKNLSTIFSLRRISRIIKSDSNSQNIFGHSSPLFVLFFVEMWERFSYYGMRVLFVIFLVEVGFGDNRWDRADAFALYGLFTGFVYLTPMFGGILADKYLGYRKAVLFGALIMTFGFFAIALETETFFYIGLLLIVLGNGLFKPNISSTVGLLYEREPELKDSAYNIFYMGINAGAFLGIMLCSYYGESPDWGYSYGFSLAGIFMLIGLVQFWFGQDALGPIGLDPVTSRSLDTAPNAALIPNEDSTDNDLTYEPGDLPQSYSGEGSEDSQSGSSQSYPRARSLENAAQFSAKQPKSSTHSTPLGSRIFLWSIIGVVIAAVQYSITASFLGPQVNTLQTFNRQIMPPIILGSVIAFIGWVVSDKSLLKVERDRVWVIIVFGCVIIFFWSALELAGGTMTIFALDYMDRTLSPGNRYLFSTVNTILTIIPLSIISYVALKHFTSVAIKNNNVAKGAHAIGFIIIWILIGNMLYEQFTIFESEIPAGWFQIFNSLFIICFTPAFVKLWDKKIWWLNRGPVRFAMGLIFLGMGFLILALGSMSIPDGAQTASVSILWLIAAYLFHTLGELCVSPIALSYVSKLAPLRLTGLMFGIFFITNFVAIFAAGLTGSYIEPISEEISLSGFFLIFTIIPILAALILLAISGWLRKLLHGIN